jgi:hypothetical protein
VSNGAIDRVILAMADPTGRLDLPAGQSPAFSPARDYVSVRICSYWQPTTDSALEMLRPRHGALHMRLSAGTAGAEDIDQRTFISPEFLGQFSKTRLDRVKQQNLLALGPVVYRPDLKLEIGLFSVQTDERVMGMLGMLNRLAESASLPRVNEALPFARALGDGLDLVLGFKDGLRLEVGLGQGLGGNSPAGTYALIFNDDDRVSLEKLFLQPNGTLVEGRKGRQLQRPHIVFEIAAQ